MGKRRKIKKFQHKLGNIARQPGLVHPQNPLQEHYLNCILECPVTIATGYPGTGKTYLPTRMASQMLKAGEIESIILMRPNRSSSKSMGFYPGTKNEKMGEWLAPILGALQEEFTAEGIQQMSDPQCGNLLMVPLELGKGLSLDNAFIIIDEAEDLTLKEVKMILTRIGDNSRIVMCGDTDQTDIGNPGILQYLDMVEYVTEFKNVTGTVKFDKAQYIVRSAACKEIVLGFERAGI